MLELRGDDNVDKTSRTFLGMCIELQVPRFFPFFLVVNIIVLMKFYTITSLSIYEFIISTIHSGQAIPISGKRKYVETHRKKFQDPEGTANGYIGHTNIKYIEYVRLRTFEDYFLAIKSNIYSVLTVFVFLILFVSYGIYSSIEDKERYYYILTFLPILVAATAESFFNIIFISHIGKFIHESTTFFNFLFPEKLSEAEKHIKLVCTKYQKANKLESVNQRNLEIKIRQISEGHSFEKVRTRSKLAHKRVETRGSLRTSQIKVTQENQESKEDSKNEDKMETDTG